MDKNSNLSEIIANKQPKNTDADAISANNYDKYQHRHAQLNLRPIHSADVNAGVIATQIYGLVCILKTMEPYGMDATGKLNDIVEELFEFVDCKTGKCLKLMQSFEDTQQLTTSALREYIYLHISILYSMLAMVCEADIEEASNVEADTDTIKHLTPLLDYANGLLDIWAEVQPIKQAVNKGANNANNT